MKIWTWLSRSLICLALRRQFSVSSFCPVMVLSMRRSIWYLQVFDSGKRVKVTTFIVEARLPSMSCHGINQNNSRKTRFGSVWRTVSAIPFRCDFFPLFSLDRSITMRFDGPCPVHYPIDSKNTSRSSSHVPSTLIRCHISRSPSFHHARCEATIY